MCYLNLSINCNDSRLFEERRGRENTMNEQREMLKSGQSVVLFCAQRQYKLYLSCIPCLCHVLHCMRCHDAMMPCLCAYLFPVIGSLASCSLLGGCSGSRPCEQAAASLAVLCFFFLVLVVMPRWPCLGEGDLPLPFPPRVRALPPEWGVALPLPPPGAPGA